MSRIAARFAELKASGRKAFIPFISAGDPDAETSLAIMEKLPAAGADIIELGMPFSDPMADGPAVQASSLRALHSGATMIRTLDMVKKFRKSDDKTPIVLMGYFNPIHAYGTARFTRDAAAAGADDLLKREEAAKDARIRAMMFEFDRTASRLTEMQTRAYLGEQRPLHAQGDTAQANPS